MLIRSISNHQAIVNGKEMLLLSYVCFLLKTVLRSIVSAQNSSGVSIYLLLSPVRLVAKAQPSPNCRKHPQLHRNWGVGKLNLETLLELPFMAANKAGSSVFLRQLMLEEGELWAEP